VASVAFFYRLLAEEYAGVYIYIYIYIYIYSFSGVCGKYTGHQVHKSYPGMRGAAICMFLPLTFTFGLGPIDGN